MSMSSSHGASNIWSSENLLNAIPLVYGVPSFVLYFIVLFVLIYRFRTPFYLLYTINGISVWSVADL